jgi:glycine cleavage system H protein
MKAMSEFLETTHDKFVFKVKIGLLYSKDDFWVEVQGDQAVIGISDFLQKVRGDVAFLETAAVNSVIQRGEEAGKIETIKATFGIISPVTGTIVEINPEIESSPYLINQEPYGTGWIYRIQLTDWASDQSALLQPQTYFELMKGKIIQETEKK